MTASQTIQFLPGEAALSARPAAPEPVSAALGERLGRLGELADSIAASRDAWIAEIVRSAKKTCRVAAGDVDLAIARLRAFGQVTPRLAGREPVGTVAVIFPGNASLSNPVATLGTAFLAGNRVLARFPRASSAWARQLEPLIAAHLPGVRFGHGGGPEFVHGVLADPEIGVLMIFGDDSWADAYEPFVLAAGKKLIFEGPGKDPFLVLPGADVERAARDAVRGAYHNAGQACTSPERFYVHRDLAADFTSRVVELTAEEVLGEPESAGTSVGPIVSRRVVERIVAQLAQATAAGARVLAGGGVRSALAADGTPLGYVEPTVLGGVTGDMSVMREETFGPVIPIQVVADAEEALALAGASPYGLAATVYGGGESEVAALGASHGQVFAGEIWLDYFARHLHAPYGGRKRSGWVWEGENGRLIRRDGVRVNAVEFSQETAT